jgi:hypothetical protein
MEQLSARIVVGLILISREIRFAVGRLLVHSQSIMPSITSQKGS